MLGRKLAHYEITEKIGVGGMGEVYRARDTKLGRDVAVKVLPEEFASDAERLARFQREAQVLASLNHPNIAAIYGVEHNSIVLELVEGPTLADRIAQGPIPIDEALAIARQITEALEAAHEAGIIHRDLKPANVKVREDGTVKVLDFGLAKALEGEAEGNASESPTMTAAATRAGVIMGTAAYMSPEQAKGKSVDKRADVWAFGVVLYEMLTGKRAFAGEDISDTLAAVLRAEPEWEALPSETSPTLRTYLGRCLEKDPKRRVRDIGDVRLAMDGAFDLSPPDVPRQPPGRLSPILLGVLVGAIVVGLGFWSSTRQAPQPLSRFALTLDAPLAAITGPPLVAISPDGRSVIYTGPDQLYLRDLDRLDTQPIPNTEGANTPFFSPDGQWVGFWARGALHKVSLSGGPAVTLTDVAARGASWGDDGTILVGAANSGLVRVPSEGGDPESVSTLQEGEIGHYRPDVLPGGKAALFTIWSGTLDTAQIAVVSLDTGETKMLVGGTFPRYAPNGHIVFAREASLWAVPFDIDRLEVTGTSTPVAEGVYVVPVSGAAQFALADNGTLLYAPKGAAGVHSLVWVDRAGSEERLVAEPHLYGYPRISPDGTRLAVDVRDEANDIWVWDFARETLTRLTFTAGLERSPVWTPDGKLVAFGSNRDGIMDIFWKAADGTGAIERLTETQHEQRPLAFSIDGKQLVFQERNPPRGWDLKLLSLDGASETLVATDFDESNAAISPNGRWLAYESAASGEPEIYVQPFPNVEEGRWQVSTGGGTRPAWGPDGRELFYLTPAGLVAVAVETELRFVAGAREMVVEGRYLGPGTGLEGRTYDIAPDGQRFLMIREGDGDASAKSELHVVLNWFDELERLVPAGGS